MAPDQQVTDLLTEVKPESNRRNGQKISKEKTWQKYTLPVVIFPSLCKKTAILTTSSLLK